MGFAGALQKLETINEDAKEINPNKEKKEKIKRKTTKVRFDVSEMAPEPKEEKE